MDLPAEVVAISRRFGHIHTMAELPIHRAVQRPCPFDTDRGPRELPAYWLLRGQQDVPLIVLDPDTRRAAWGPDGIDGHQASGSGTVVLASGCTLTLLFEGSPAVYTDYPRAEVLETATAVTIIPVAVELYDGPRLDYLEQRQVIAVVADRLAPASSSTT